VAVSFSHKCIAKLGQTGRHLHLIEPFGRLKWQTANLTLAGNDAVFPGSS
jgi:hypothetical protein